MSLLRLGYVLVFFNNKGYTKQPSRVLFFFSVPLFFEKSSMRSKASKGKEKYAAPLFVSFDEGFFKGSLRSPFSFEGIPPSLRIQASHRKQSAFFTF